MKSKTRMIDLYCDGGCSPNPGFGTSAFAVVVNNKLIHSDCSVQAISTNNIAELTSVIKGLEWCRGNYSSIRIQVLIDSKYVKLGVTEWANKWVLNNWMTGAKKPVKNKELWVRLLNVVKQLNPEFIWVKGHNGNKWNEYVDGICTQTYREAQMCETL